MIPHLLAYAIAPDLSFAGLNIFEWFGIVCFGVIVLIAGLAIRSWIRAANPPRRWFQFSLRTIFVVLAVFGLWTIESVKWIKQRREVLRKDAVYGNQTIPPLFSTPTAPGGLWMFGERGHEVIRVNTSLASEAEVLEIRRLFPEANLWLRENWPGREGDRNLAPGEYP